MKLRFLGAAGTVTGSRTLVEARGKRLLVDCGLFQGVKALRERNWHPLPVPAESIDAVLLTHAHIDHCGYLPVLVRAGFRGPIYCTDATLDLATILLADAAHLQEEDAKHANRYRYSKHSPALPLFRVDDAERAVSQMVRVDRGVPIQLGDLVAHFIPAGHILGAASITLTDGVGTVAFSGDLGRDDDPIALPPTPLHVANAVIIESTYGDREHPSIDAKEQLARVVNETAARSGVLLIPAFAVGRAQLLVHTLLALKDEHRVGDIPVVLNSPLAARVLGLYEKHCAWHRLSREQCARLSGSIHIVASVEESKALSARAGPLIIIAGSGMATGGRVVHHLETLLPDARNTVLLAGFQAPGTRGASLASGAKTITIHGKDVVSRAAVVTMEQLSAHTDANGLIRWLSHFTPAPEQTFVTHGEPAASDALRHRIETTLHRRARAPSDGESIELW